MRSKENLAIEQFEDKRVEFFRQEVKKMVCAAIAADPKSKMPGASFFLSGIQNTVADFLTDATLTDTPPSEAEITKFKNDHPIIIMGAGDNPFWQDPRAGINLLRSTLEVKLDQLNICDLPPVHEPKTANVSAIAAQLDSAERVFLGRHAVVVKTSETGLALYLIRETDDLDDDKRIEEISRIVNFLTENQATFAEHGITAETLVIKYWKLSEPDRPKLNTAGLALQKLHGAEAKHMFQEWHPSDRAATAWTFEGHEDSNGLENHKYDVVFQIPIATKTEAHFEGGQRKDDFAFAKNFF